MPDAPVFLPAEAVVKLLPFPVHEDTLRRWERTVAFPKRRRFGHRVYWIEQEVLNWLEDQVALPSER